MLVEVAARTFGKPLTVAATRGKLEFSEGVCAPVSAQVSPQVTPQGTPMPKRSPEMVVIRNSVVIGL
ncbi:MAG: hypothetical protein ACRC8Y_08415 [Chroococcales cyanobacterium]